MSRTSIGGPPGVPSTHTRAEASSIGSGRGGFLWAAPERMVGDTKREGTIDLVAAARSGSSYRLSRTVAGRIVPRARSTIKLFSRIHVASHE